MTFQEAHKDGKNGLVIRRNLSFDKLTERLLNYFTEDEIEDIINSSSITGVDAIGTWTDGNIVIIQSCLNHFAVVVANGNYMKLIEP